MANNHLQSRPPAFDQAVDDTHGWTEVLGNPYDRSAGTSPSGQLRLPRVVKSNNPLLRGTSSSSLKRNAASQLSGLSSPSTISLPTSNSIESTGICRNSLGDYFAMEESQRVAYTDNELGEISRLLKDADREQWSRIPRIYTVLRRIGQITAIDAFLDQGINDLWLPFNVAQLPKSMTAFHRENFVQMQNMVLTKAMDLENNSVKRHTHFKQGEPFPFDVTDTLGHGGYASVDKVRSTLSGRAYARKRFRRNRAKLSEVQSFITELQVLQRINHHHCVELVASYTDPKYFGLLMSPVADCDLSAFYDRVPDNEENQKAFLTFFGCLSHALQFLHQSRIRHRDIKPQNILVKGSSIYLADFGISLDWENLSRSTTTEDSGKSWMYCAPEVAQYQKRNSSSDVWSLGCVFLEMLTIIKGLTVQEIRDLFRGNSGRARFHENHGIAMAWAEQLNGLGHESEIEIVHWIRQMMAMEPSDRISAESLSVAIVQHGQKYKNITNTNIFCGDCCSHSHELDSSSEEVSDDDVWMRAVDENLTPDTSPHTTDDSLQNENSIVARIMSASLNDDDRNEQKDASNYDRPPKPDLNWDPQAFGDFAFFDLESLNGAYPAVLDQAERPRTSMKSSELPVRLDSNYDPEPFSGLRLFDFEPLNTSLDRTERNIPETLENFHEQEMFNGLSFYDFEPLNTSLDRTEKKLRGISNHSSLPQPLRGGNDQNWDHASFALKASTMKRTKERNCTQRVF